MNNNIKKDKTNKKCLKGKVTKKNEGKSKNQRKEIPQNPKWK